MRWLAFLCAQPLLLGVVHCGGEDSRAGLSSAKRGLQLSGDASVTSALYALAGPNDFASAGTVAVGDSPDVPVTLAPLPVGEGYQLELTATASDESTVCHGSSDFDVADSTEAIAVVTHLECAPRTGNVRLEGTFHTCPVLDGLSASPTSLVVGGVANVSIVAHDSDQSASELTYTWTVNGISLTRQTAATLRFGCSSVGRMVISATVSDGNPACADSKSIEVICE